MKDALFHLDQIEGVGLQAQLRSAMVSAIVSRHLSPGECLPSTRKMASRLGVSRNTVTLVYQALASEGYLDSKERSGFRVALDAPVVPVAQQIQTDSALDWSGRLDREIETLSEFDKPKNWREYRYPFVYGQADPGLFQHSDWRDCARQALGMRNFERLAGDFAIEDDPMLVDYIRARTLPMRGVLAKPEEVLVTMGAQNALWLMAALLVQAGDRVAIEDPGYPDLRAMLRARGAEIVPLPVGSDGISIDDRLKGVRIVFCTPSHQTPTTRTMSMAKRKALLAAADKEDFIIVEDDYEFEMSYLAKPIPALKSLDRSGRTIYAGSFSKTLFPGLRLGYLVAPAPVIEKARALRRLIYRHPPGLTQRTVAYFLALGHYDALVKRLRTAFQARREALLAGLETADLETTHAPDFGGVSVWVRAPDEVNTEILAKSLQEQGVLIESGAKFFASATPPTCYFRLACSSIPLERIPDGLKILRQNLSRSS